MITIEQIDEFRKRTHSSYEDAKYFLEKNNGEILDAIIDFERTKSGRGQNHQFKKHPDEFGKRFADILQKGFDTRIYVEDKSSTLFTIPIVLLILLIPLWVIVILFFILLSMLGYKFSVRDVKSKNVNVNTIFQNINDKMKEAGGGKTNPKDQAHEADSNPGTAPSPVNNNTQVPIRVNPNPPSAPETRKPELDADKEAGYKEYTIE